jgi:hypothetical protein
MYSNVPRAPDTVLIDAVMAWARPKSASLITEKSSEHRTAVVKNEGATGGSA